MNLHWKGSSDEGRPRRHIWASSGPESGYIIKLFPKTVCQILIMTPHHKPSPSQPRNFFANSQMRSRLILKNQTIYLPGCTGRLLEKQNPSQKKSCSLKKNGSMHRWLVKMDHVFAPKADTHPRGGTHFPVGMAHKMGQMIFVAGNRLPLLCQLPGRENKQNGSKHFFKGGAGKG